MGLSLMIIDDLVLGKNWEELGRTGKNWEELGLG